MSDIVHADIFFFISSIAAVIGTITIIVVSGYVVLIMRDLKAISAKVRKASDKLEGDFDELRAHAREESGKAKYIVDMILGFVSRTLGGNTRLRPRKKSKTNGDTH